MRFMHFAAAAVGRLAAVAVLLAAGGAVFTLPAYAGPDHVGSPGEDGQDVRCVLPMHSADTNVCNAIGGDGTDGGSGGGSGGSE